MLSIRELGARTCRPGEVIEQPQPLADLPHLRFQLSRAGVWHLQERCAQQRPNWILAVLPLPQWQLYAGMHRLTCVYKCLLHSDICQWLIRGAEEGWPHASLLQALSVEHQAAADLGGAVDAIRNDVDQSTLPRPCWPHDCKHIPACIMALAPPPP